MYAKNTTYHNPLQMGGLNPQLILPHLTRPNPTLVIDLNNTLMDQRAGVVRFSKGALTMADLDQWDKDNSSKMGLTREQYLTWAWKNPYIELLSPAFPGAAQAMRQVKRAGIRIVIATASNLSPREIENWLNWNVIPFDRIVRTDDKRGLGHLLIDDNPFTVEAFYREGLPVLRYALPWNAHLHYIQGINWRN